MLQQILTIVSSLFFVVPVCDKVAIAYSGCSAVLQAVYKVGAL